MSDNNTAEHAFIKQMVDVDFNKFIYIFCNNFHDRFIQTRIK